MERSTKILIWVTAYLATCASSHAVPADDSLLADAESFMLSYAADLGAGNRSALAGRYDSRGAYFVGSGKKRFMGIDDIQKQYQSTWQPPSHFSWSDLSYEIISPNAVVVVGAFDWETTDKGVRHYSYTGLLIRVDGKLRIRLEDESAQSK